MRATENREIQARYLSPPPRGVPSRWQYGLALEASFRRFESCHSDRKHYVSTGSNDIYIMKTCDNCSSLTDGSYGSGRFCSSKCARGFSTKAKRGEINDKISLSLRGVTWKNGTKTDTVVHKSCIECGVKFLLKHTQQICCSKKCAYKRRTKTNKKIILCKECNIAFLQKRKNQIYCSGYCQRHSADVRAKNSAKMQERIANGLHHGWPSRKIKSYAEKFFEVVLKNNGIKFDSERKIKKMDLGLNCSMNYFLDFYLPDYNLDLEIDGRQHEMPDRIKSDAIRDEALNKFGIKVYRIKWKNPNTASRKEYLKNEIDKFLTVIK